MWNKNLTLSEKGIIKDSLELRLEDKLHHEFAQRLRNIIYILESDEPKDFTIFQKNILIQQLELRIETDIDPQLKEKIRKIITKLHD